MIIDKPTEKSKSQSGLLIVLLVILSPAAAIAITTLAGQRWLPVAELSCFLLPALVYFFLSKPANLTQTPQLLPFLGVIFFSVVLAFAIDAILPLWHQIFGTPSGYQKSIERFLHSGASHDLMQNLIFAAALPALCEECFFRGLVQTTLSQRLSPTRGLILAAALFGAAHAVPQYFLIYVVLGLFFGLVYRRLGLIAAITAHFAYNATGVLMMTLAR
jgi:membrane protease YdiL (CAAX protease family)